MNVKWFRRIKYSKLFKVKSIILFDNCIIIKPLSRNSSMKPPTVMIKKQEVCADSTRIKEVRLLMGVNYTNIDDSVSVVMHTAFLFLIKDTTEIKAFIKATFNFVSSPSPNSLTLPKYRETFIISSKPDTVRGS